MKAILDWLLERDATDTWTDFSPAAFLDAGDLQPTRTQLNSVLRSLERLENRSPALVRRRRGSGAGYDGKAISLRLTGAGRSVARLLREPRIERERPNVPVYYKAQRADMLFLDIFRYASEHYRGRRPDEPANEWRQRTGSLLSAILEREAELAKLSEEYPEALASARANFLTAMTWVYPNMLASDFYLQEEIELSSAYEERLEAELAAVGLDPKSFALVQPLSSNDKRMSEDSEVPW